MHPNFVNNWRDFTENDIIKIHHGWINYQVMFTTASLLITDYSSIAFDFAYLKKPVIYTQFDKMSFMTNHILRKGYFDYETHGFGPVCNDMNSTITQIMHYIKNGCSMEYKYQSRVMNFFAFFDGNNCERVLTKILSCKDQPTAPPQLRLLIIIPITIGYCVNILQFYCFPLFKYHLRWKAIKQD